MRPQRFISWATGLLTIAFALLLVVFNPSGLVPLLFGCFVVGGALFLVAFLIGLVDKERAKDLPPIYEEKNAAKTPEKPRGDA
jgi:peptidoglycan/LPS O-acetylase OafA/YrhL